ncbi:MupG family TIM beta-alpha barrel fold protein [Ligilactobacillus sp. WILCCON 0076]|uniref:MupG family TIM beta-alpha barrel fold protein n=1 Tax=Ligilactobacillus ubinensis TaxID=2876789 RepID=A0A9X2JLL7_9LACO|nr:MupG family TIM beta-alpha barrel fold protein [Ligilactobacillus ubinensis]MCP0887113.1 MupG family TIM beta-alpha barrel fold protein [Ligilactobacillus ubinensis]
MLGISVYPNKSTVEECNDYINKAARLGYKRLFTSLLELQPENIDQTVAAFKKVLHHAKTKKMWVSLDINPHLFKLLNIDYDNLSFFKDLGADIIRLDMNFDGLSESIMTYDKSGLLLEVNISNDTGNIANTFSYSPLKNKIIGCHNFYPQPFTGLDTDYFLKTTAKYKQMGLRTAAFISSEAATQGPHAYNDGLPTLEIHRHSSLVQQAQYLINTKLIDDIIIGNAFASEKELKDVAKLNLELAQFFIAFLPGTTDLEKEIILDNLHFNRGDINSYSIRSTFVKLKYANSDIPINNALYKLEKGDVTLGNNSFGQYKGEVSIVKQSMPNTDKHKNVVAKVCSSNTEFIDFIKPWDKFKFIDVTTY